MEDCGELSGSNGAKPVPVLSLEKPLLPFVFGGQVLQLADEANKPHDESFVLGSIPFLSGYLKVVPVTHVHLICHIFFQLVDFGLQDINSSSSSAFGNNFLISYP